MTCAGQACERPSVSQGYCWMHYMRLYRTGRTTLLTQIERFWSHVDKDGPPTKAELGPCWLWTGGTSPDGYGKGQMDGRTVRAHRAAYQLLVGPIPDGLVLDHLCRTILCVNPSHLEPVTNQVNILRGETIMAAHAAKTTCDNGHPFDDLNTYARPTGGRRCRACNADAVRAYRARKRQGSATEPQ